MRARAASQSSPTARSSPMSMRDRDRAGAGRDEVRAEVAEGRERPVRARRRLEATEAAARDVLEEDPLDRVARAELEHLLVGRLDRAHGGRLEPRPGRALLAAPVPARGD